METNMMLSETELQKVKVTLQDVRSQRDELQQQLDRLNEQSVELRTPLESANAHGARLQATNQQVEHENEVLAKKVRWKSCV